MKNILCVLIAFVLVSLQTKAQTAEEIQRIREASNLEALRSLVVKYTAEEERKKERVRIYAQQNNIPIIRFNPNGSFDQLMDVLEDGTLIYYTVDNVNAALSTRTNHLNTGGSLGLNLNGQNMTAYVWDGGPARTTHQEFGGRVVVGDGVVAINANSDHATHVTGTIGAAGIVPAAKGMAAATNVRTHDWNNDLVEATIEAGNGMLLSNHSYGWGANSIKDWLFGAYVTISRDWDEIMFNAPFYLMVKSAGNDGDNDVANADPLEGNVSFDKLSGREISKNNLVIANAEDANVDVDGNLINVTIYSESSEGPTDDLRIKPDITGNGYKVYSTYSTLNGTDADYATMTGTSMSSPNVTGTLLLLQQHYNNLNGNFMRAASLKGLALHTADDAGTPGPDAIFGWGLLNAKKAAEAISQNGSSATIQELTLAQGQSHNLIVTADGINSLQASISWTDPPGTINNGIANLATPVLVNDLDIRITKNGGTSFPYKLTSVTTNDTGDNIVDPYERIDIANAAGQYTITVSHKGILTNGNQNFSLIVTGITHCSSDVIITGLYNESLTESSTWITSSAQTTILNTADVRLDAHPTNGYVELRAVGANDFFLSSPTGNGVFIAQALDGCGVATPARLGYQASGAEIPAETESIAENNEHTLSVFPNPATQSFTLVSSVEIKEDAVIELTNIIGKAALITIDNIDGHTKKIHWNTKPPAGIYIVLVKTGTMKRWVKIIIE